jgi:hypothetical protein
MKHVHAKFVAVLPMQQSIGVRIDDNMNQTGQRK